jgi:hypothetical protein
VVHTTDEPPLKAAEAVVPEAVVELLPLAHATTPRQSAPASAEAKTPFVVPTDFVFIRTPKT